MKRMLITLFLGLSLHPASSMDLPEKSVDDDEMSLEKAIEPLDSSNNRFSDLVKSTMDLLGPDLEMTQTTEMKTDSKSRPNY